MTKKLFSLSIIVMTSVAIFAAYSKVYAEEPICLDVDPSYIEFDNATNINITCENTNFVNGLTKVDFGCPLVT
jgi:hypothetical protein